MTHLKPTPGQRDRRSRYGLLATIAIAACSLGFPADGLARADMSVDGGRLRGKTIVFEMPPLDVKRIDHAELRPGSRTLGRGRVVSGIKRGRMGVPLSAFAGRRKHRRGGQEVVPGEYHLAIWFRRGLPQEPLGSSAVSGPKFSADSPWNVPIPPDAALDPRSEELTGTLLRTVEKQTASRGGPGLTATAFTPMYEVAADAPRFPVSLDTGPWADSIAAEFARGVPVPPNPATAGSDGALVVWQPDTDTYWELAQLQQALHFPQFVGVPKLNPGGLLAAGIHRYQVTALNENGETTAKPAALSVKSPGGRTVTFSWSQIDGATGYSVYRDDGSGFARVATVAADQTRFTDDGLAAPLGPQPPATNTAITPGSWHASYGGVMYAASRGPGYFRDVAGGDGALIEQHWWGASGSGLAKAAGMVTRADLESGRIDHALSIGLPNLPGASVIDPGAWAFPAQRTDGKSTLAAAIPEGARFRLDPSINLNALDLAPGVRMLAEAAQRYGMIVHDGSPGTVFYGESPQPYMRAGEQNFYERYFAASTARRSQLAAFPWNRLQLLEMTLCRDASRPCNTQGQ